MNKAKKNFSDSKIYKKIDYKMFEYFVKKSDILKFS